MTLYLMVFKPFIENKDKYEYLKSKVLLNKLDSCVSNVILSPDNIEERLKFWSFIDSLKLDHDSESSLFGESGYISGLFQIFHNNQDFCMEIEKLSKCVICDKETKSYYFENCLLSINNGNINVCSIEKILNLKYAIGITNCEKDNVLSV